MKDKIKNRNQTFLDRNSLGNKFSNLMFFGICLLVLGFISCTDFVEVDAPKNSLIAQTVFDDASTVESALANVYFKIRDQSMVSGNNGLSTLLGVYTDELEYYLLDANYIQLYQNNVLASNGIVGNWWRDAYAIVYAANDIIKGVENSTSLSSEDKAKFKGQALFVRAYIHSLLVGLYGDVPYIATTNYLENNKVSRLPAKLVYTHCITDLIEAVTLLDNDTMGERVIPNNATANALLARLFLYTENWKMAEITASSLISDFRLETDITKVFLKNASSTLWQLKPDGVSNRNTYEANQFNIRFIPGQSFALHSNLLTSFESGDLRDSNWVGTQSSSDGLTTLYFANKYKSIFSATESHEYSIIFRLEEQYLIRSEARAQLENTIGSQTDLNVIRNRAGLANTTANSKEDLLDAILQERFVELFTEQGHRWFDLKRMGMAKSVLEPIKTNWKDTDLLLPIPEIEIEINPNLKPQNIGY